MHEAFGDIENQELPIFYLIQIDPNMYILNKQTEM